MKEIVIIWGSIILTFLFTIKIKDVIIRKNNFTMVSLVVYIFTIFMFFGATSFTLKFFVDMI